jgi:hypothetical protein
MRYLDSSPHFGSFSCSQASRLLGFYASPYSGSFAAVFPILVFVDRIPIFGEVRGLGLSVVRHLAAFHVYNVSAGDLIYQSIPDSDQSPFGRTTIPFFHMGRPLLLLCVWIVIQTSGNRAHAHRISSEWPLQLFGAQWKGHAFAGMRRILQQKHSREVYQAGLITNLVLPKEDIWLGEKESSSVYRLFGFAIPSAVWTGTERRV